MDPNRADMLHEALRYLNAEMVNVLHKLLENSFHFLWKPKRSFIIQLWSSVVLRSSILFLRLHERHLPITDDLGVGKPRASSHKLTEVDEIKSKVSRMAKGSPYFNILQKRSITRQSFVIQALSSPRCFSVERKRSSLMMCSRKSTKMPDLLLL